MDRSSILRASTISNRQVDTYIYLPFYFLSVPRRIELYAGRGRKENASAFLARGRGRRQAAEAGADLRSKYADSPCKLPTQNGCDVIESQPAMRRINGTPNPRRIELCAGRGRKENASAFLARGRGRRQAAEAGADLRSKYADSPRNAPAQYRCDADRASCPGLAPSTDPPYRGESNSVQGAGVKQTLRQRRVGRAFPMAAQAESTSRNPHSDWDVVSGWHIKRKLHPGILIRNGIHLPDDGLSGKCDPEFALRPGRAFPSTAPTP